MISRLGSISQQVIGCILFGNDSRGETNSEGGDGREGRGWLRATKLGITGGRRGSKRSFDGVVGRCAVVIDREGRAEKF